MDNNENITPEVQKLLDAIASHGSNRRRQEELSDLIDSLAAQESPKRHIWPWVGIAAVAACIALILIPTREPNMVADVRNPVIITPAMEAPIVSTPVREEPVPIAATVSKFYDTCIPQTSTISTDTFVSVPQIDTSTPFEPTPIQEVAPMSVPTRRVVSTQLICYDCAPTKERHSAPNVNLMGIPIDPNMNGSMLALATF